MADQTPPLQRHMSLIPYSHDSREIVLRRGNAVVVYDQNSRQLQVRDTTDNPIELTECPYCHRSMRSREPSGEESEYGRAFGPERPFVAPDYFAMLASSRRPSPAGSGSSTPSRRVLSALRSGRSREVSGSADPPTGAEFVGSEPATAGGQGISASAFSPGYFEQFFKTERELGRGGNGVVLLVEHVIDDVSLGHFACKRIPVGDSKAYFEKVIIEVRLLQKIPHKNLVAYHWTWLEDHQPSTFGPSIPCLWILQDYCNGGDLHTYVLGPKTMSTEAERLKARLRRRSKGDASPPQDLRGPSKLAFDEIFSFFRDITSGLHHLHSKGYIHRDLKPSNCLLQRDGGRTRVLISDFGEVQAAGAMRGSSGATGTISYCAPEVLQRTSDGSLGNFTTKSDIFSLGMIVFFMCFGRLPYANADDINEENEDLDGLRAEIQRWAGFNDETRSRLDLPERLYKYLKRLLSVDPNERPSTDEILASIKGGAALGDPGSYFDDRHPRVSSVDSPAPATRIRQQSYIARPSLASPVRHRSSGDIRSRSPIKREQRDSRPTSPLDSPLTVGPKRLNLSPPSIEDAVSPQQSPRLMLPPPPVRPVTAKLRHILHDPRTVLILRASLFVAKILTLSIPCRPYAANQWLLYSLLCLAATDLGLLSFSLRQSSLLFACHIVMVWLASQSGRLCEATKAPVWQDI
ncbi:putative serine/threonine-protein kinase iksA [Fulvia fulva]|nr:putative serine/threonine-protein kinase iksA [Fulvia fulva]